MAAFMAVVQHFWTPSCMSGSQRFLHSIGGLATLSALLDLQHLYLLVPLSAFPEGHQTVSPCALISCHSTKDFWKTYIHKLPTPPTPPPPSGDSGALPPGFRLIQRPCILVCLLSAAGPHAMLECRCPRWCSPCDVPALRAHGLGLPAAPSLRTSVPCFLICFECSGSTAAVWASNAPCSFCVC